MGNDLAGSKVISGLTVDNNPELTKDMDKLDSLIPGLFPACAVTRAAARQAALQSSREAILKDLRDKGAANNTDDHVNVEAIKCTGSAT